MVYADVPEHEGLNDGTAADKAPRPVSTDGWLERISDQLQVFVDKLQELTDEDDDPDAGADDGADDKSGDTPPADDKSGDDASKADPKKTTPAPKKTTEVKGD